MARQQENPVMLSAKSCHAERSEASRGPCRETLRCAQGDKKGPCRETFAALRACPEAKPNGVTRKGHPMQLRALSASRPSRLRPSGILELSLRLRHIGRPAKKRRIPNKQVRNTLHYIFWMMTSLKLSCKLIVTNQQECRGRSPLPGFGVSPNYPLILPPQAASTNKTECKGRSPLPGFGVSPRSEVL
jgi:hypothetical protein